MKAGSTRRGGALGANGFGGMAAVLVALAALIGNSPWGVRAEEPTAAVPAADQTADKTAEQAAAEVEKAAQRAADLEKDVTQGALRPRWAKRVRVWR